MTDAPTVPTDIPELSSSTNIVAIAEGWSADRKFRVLSNSGATWMLRLSDIRHREKKRFEYECLCKAEEMNLPTPRPVSFGECDDGAQNYLLLTWVEGVELREVLAKASRSKQYALGFKAGKLLRQLQDIPVPHLSKSWEQMFLGQLEERGQRLAETCIDLPERDAFLMHIEQYRHLLAERPLKFVHGDYHVGNLLVTSNGELASIDFDRCRVADPWDDHKRVVWDLEASTAFASGRLNGYFEDKIPEDFWALLAAYCASNAIGSIAWAVPFGDEQIEHHLHQARRLFESYKGMRRIVPEWYCPPHGRHGACPARPLRVRNVSFLNGIARPNTPDRQPPSSSRLVIDELLGKTRSEQFDRFLSKPRPR